MSKFLKSAAIFMLCALSLSHHAVAMAPCHLVLNVVGEPRGGLGIAQFLWGDRFKGLRITDAADPAVQVDIQADLPVLQEISRGANRRIRQVGNLYFIEIDEQRGGIDLSSQPFITHTFVVQRHTGELVGKLYNALPVELPNGNYIFLSTVGPLVVHTLDVQKAELRETFSDPASQQTFQLVHGYGIRRHVFLVPEQARLIYAYVGADARLDNKNYEVVSISFAGQLQGQAHIFPDSLLELKRTKLQLIRHAGQVAVLVQREFSASSNAGIYALVGGMCFGKWGAILAAICTQVNVKEGALRVLEVTEQGSFIERTPTVTYGWRDGTPN